MEIKKTSTNSTSENGVQSQTGENYHLYFVTLNPSFKSYIKRSYQDSSFMKEVFGEFMQRFSKDFKMVDCGIEYNTKDTAHIHIVLASTINTLEFHYDGFSANDIIFFKKGIHVDFRIFPHQDLNKVITYISKISKPHEVMNYYRNNYGFI